MTLLDASEVTLRLLSRGLLGKGEDIVVRDLSRRNRGYAITEKDRAFFVKQNVDGARALRRETSIYRRAGRETGRSLAPYLPRLHYQDGRVVVLELLAGARTLTDCVGSRRAASAAACARLGEALRLVHSSPPRSVSRAERPWVLELAAPPVEMLRDASAANVELLRIIHQSEFFCSALASLRSAWRASALIHGDLRADNVMVQRGAGRLRDDIRIIDWELSGIGDPAWDVGSVIGSFLSLWISSLPFVPGTSLPRLVKLARIPLARIRPGIGAFWSAYAAELPPRARRALLARALRFAAARLVQHAWEESCESVRLTGNAICALQLSANLLSDPDTAKDMVFGRSE